MPKDNSTRAYFCKEEFRSPLVLPSGIFTTLKDFKNAEHWGIGAVTTKSYTYYPRRGNKVPTVAKFGDSFLNSVGLRNLGISEAKKQIVEFRSKLKVPLFISIFDTKIKDFSRLVLHLLPLKPDFIELNLSCPNVEDDYGKPLATAAKSAFKVVKLVKSITGDGTNIVAKLTPNVPDIKEIAVAVEEAGADGITAINALGGGMLIDVKNKKPVLGAGSGAISGPALKPVALKCVYDIYDAVDIPIIGLGGVTDARDAIAMFMAGATLVGVGSAIYLKGMKVIDEINRGIAKYLKENRFKTVSEIVGLAHE